MDLQDDSVIPPDVYRNNCVNEATGLGAITITECGTPNLAADRIFYYLFPDSAALGNGYSSFKKITHFRKTAECMTYGRFVDFIVNCESTFSSKSANISGSIAEHTNITNGLIIITTDKRRHVIAIMVGTDAGDLMAYWRQYKWAVS